MSQSDNELIQMERDPGLAYWEELQLFMPVSTFVRMMEVMGRDFPTGLTLYLFYRYTAKRHKTDKPWALDDYVRKSLGWTQDKLNKAKKLLVQHGFMEVKEVKMEKKT